MLSNYLFAKFDSETVLIMFPDQTGNVYLASNSVPVHTFGHWQTAVKKVAALGIDPIARLVRDEGGLLSYQPFDTSVDVEMYCAIVTKAEKLLGIDWTIPLNQQKQKIINKALFYIGQSNTVELAYDLIQRSAVFTDKSIIVNKAMVFKPVAVPIEPAKVETKAK